MKALAAYICAGRWQAILVSTVSAILAFLFPPVSSLLSYAGAAVVGLVTLHVGRPQGLQVLAASCLLTMLFYMLVGMPGGVIVVTLLMLWAPSWMIAAILQRTHSLGSALKAASLFGACLLLLVYVFAGDPAAWWLENLRTLVAELNKAGFDLQELTADVLARIAALMSGVVLASLVLGISASLLLARWWQSVLVHPGAFRDEFYRLRLGHAAGLLTLLVMTLSWLLPGRAHELGSQLAMILLVPYLLTGLAVIHSLLARAGRGGGWLVAVYIMLAFVPQAALLLAAGGLLDTWVDFRTRLGVTLKKP